MANEKTVTRPVDRFPLYNETLAWEYRFKGIYSDVLELSNAARKDAEKRLAALLAKEYSRLTLEEDRWSRLTKQKSDGTYEVDLMHGVYNVSVEPLLVESQS